MQEHGLLWDSLDINVCWTCRLLGLMPTIAGPAVLGRWKEHQSITRGTESCPGVAVPDVGTRRTSSSTA